MYAIMGISGRVGGAVASHLRAQGQGVRAVVRSADKGAPWQVQGCEVALADAADSEALASAFMGAEAAFVMLPPAFDQAPGLTEGHARAEAIGRALRRARPARVVALSTYGAHVQRPNLFTELGYLEQVLAGLDLPVTVLRAAWYMENHAWDVPSARARGVIASHLQPLARALPMVSAHDVGLKAAQLLLDRWPTHRVVEFEGPEPVSPLRLAEAFTRALGREVRVEAVPRASWEAGFRQTGMQHPLSWMQSLDGTNEGWLAFEGPADTRQRGATTIDQVVASMLRSEG